ncbi:DUF2085 domain-containing protein [Halalkalibaculum sp. DA3122]|uniref:DUF2085 domain-containing protein n=1 Tax=unclassified Halalkalibaculum TaxID=2964617 RepID=UPI0037547BBD
MNIPGLKYNRSLYLGVAGLCLLLVVAASGPGLLGNAEFWLNSWQHQAFRTLCHQDPTRSFWINGTPMAVCARCFGIYAAFTFFWLAIPLIGNPRFIIPVNPGRLLMIAIALNGADVVGNLLGFWQNTAFTRSVMGALIGSMAVLILADEFLKTNDETERDAYGFKELI